MIASVASLVDGFDALCNKPEIESADFYGLQSLALGIAAKTDHQKICLFLASCILERLAKTIEGLATDEAPTINYQHVLRLLAALITSPDYESGTQPMLQLIDAVAFRRMTN